MPAKLAIAATGRPYTDKQLTRRQQKAADNCGFLLCDTGCLALA